MLVNVEAVVYRDGRVLLGTRAASEEHAAGERSLVGGTIERDPDPSRPLETTVEREVLEETGVEIVDVTYVRSSAFETDEGDQCVNVVFRARHTTGDARVREPDETVDLDWVDPARVLDDDVLPPWTARYLERADADRHRDGW